MTVRILLILSLALAGCSSNKEAAGAQERHAQDLEHKECAACGMTVREQPAPRGQLIHRDGTQLYFCSISDMLTYLTAPSPHGAAVTLFVESLDKVLDPLVPATEQLPWLDAKSASYVIGVDKNMVMGRPVLSYSSAEHAQDIATRHGGSVVTWKQLQGK